MVTNELLFKTSILLQLNTFATFLQLQVAKNDSVQQLSRQVGYSEQFMKKSRELLSINKSLSSSSQSNVNDDPLWDVVY